MYHWQLLHNVIWGDSPLWKFAIAIANSICPGILRSVIGIKVSGLYQFAELFDYKCLAIIYKDEFRKCNRGWSQQIDDYCVHWRRHLLFFPILCYKWLVSIPMYYILILRYYSTTLPLYSPNHIYQFRIGTAKT